MSDFIRGLWPSSILTWLSFLTGAMSLLKLVEFGFSYRLWTLHPILDAYDHFLQVVVDLELPWWAEPIFQVAVSVLQDWFGQFQVYGHWKHVFVLMSLYFFRTARNSFVAADLPATGTFELLWGLVVAFVTSIAVGALLAPQDDLWQSFLFAGFPIVGLMAYDFVRAIWVSRVLAGRMFGRLGLGAPSRFEFFLLQLRVSAFRNFIGLAILLIGLMLPQIQQLRSPGLAMLGLLVLLLAGRLIVLGVRDARTIHPQEPWAVGFWKTAGANVGAAMLGVYFWAAVIVMADLVLARA